MRRGRGNKFRGYQLIDQHFDSIQSLFHADRTSISSVPERVLMIPVIDQAITDLALNYHAPYRNTRPFYEAIEWFFGNDDTNRAAFREVCDMAEISSSDLLRKAARVLHRGLENRLPRGASPDFEKRRSRRHKSKFSQMAAPGIGI